MAEHGWVRSLVDAAMWCRWKTLPNGSCVLEGIVVAHVDDLLFTGSAEAEKSLMAIGDELGFGSLDRTTSPGVGNAYGVTPMAPSACQ